MEHSDHQSNGHANCPACELGPFTRNNYFTGKLMVERDFTDEARFHIDKLRHHHQRLHGWGVVCGLKVKQHENPACRSRYVCIEPGTAIDCCGHEILVREEECIDITQLEAWKALKKQEQNEKDPGPHTLQICLRYRECCTENVPVLFDECGCDDTKCAPNRILESYDIGLLIDPDTTEKKDADCKEIPWRHLEGCPHCEKANCVVLATIENYRLNDRMLDMPFQESDLADRIARIDNRNGRRLLPSTQTLYEMIECVLKQPPGGGGVGPEGPPGPPGVGLPGKPGDPGKDGAGLETGLTRINALSWKHGDRSSLVPVRVRSDGEKHGLVIGFTGVVDTKTIDANHVFEVSMQHLASKEQKEMGFVCWCAVQGEIVPVSPVSSSSDDKVIVAAEETGAMASGVAFIPNDVILNKIQEQEQKEPVWVRLRGDFIIDKSGRAIDAEFVRAELPTGNRPDKKGTSSPTDLGIQGGLFESWFTVTPK